MDHVQWLTGKARAPALRALLLTLAGALGLTPNAARAAAAVLPDLQGQVGEALDAMVPMRDGVHLWTTVYFPKKPALPAPVVLLRTPYSFALEVKDSKGVLAHLLERGYILVLQNERGRFWSEGVYRLAAGAATDGYDTIDWIAHQPWSNAKVGTIGCSSSGDNQVPLMTLAHPAHAAAITMASGSSISNIGPFNEQGLFYRGGAVQLAWAWWYAALGQRDFPKFPPGIVPENRDWLATAALKGSWMEDMGAVSANLPDIRSLPIKDLVHEAHGQITDWDEYVARTPDDPAWNAMPLLRPGDKIGVPALWVLQSHDIGVGPDLAAFEYAIGAGATAKAKNQQYLIISALAHCSYLDETEHTIDGERPIGDARLAYTDIFTRFFDRQLRGMSGEPAPPRAQVYVPGRDQWLTFDAWPPKSSRYTLHLGSALGANTRLGDGALTAAAPAHPGKDSFPYDPRYPVPSRGGDACCGSAFEPGSYDHNDIELRHDVLVYKSETLKQPLTVVGFVEASLAVSSDAPDTDFTANLIDVAPDGTAYILSGSIQRARWRDGYAQRKLMKPGEVYRVRVGPFYVSNEFKAGHRIALEVSSSNFPRFDRNLNTGGNNFDEKSGRIAVNTIHFGPGNDSYVAMPVLDGPP